MVKKKLRVIQPSRMPLAIVFYSVHWIDSLHWIFWVLFISLRINFDKFKFSLSESKYWFLWIIKNSIMLLLLLLFVCLQLIKRCLRKNYWGVWSLSKVSGKKDVCPCMAMPSHHHIIEKLFVNIIFKTISSRCIYTYTIYLIILFSFLNLFIFLLKGNCFTEFFCFLSNLNMNQP